MFIQLLGNLALRKTCNKATLAYFLDVRRIRQGVALLDLANPAKVIVRCSMPVLGPKEPWEIKGDVPNVVFSCGQAVKEGVVYLYYEGADRVMAVATAPLDELLKLVSG
jgi:predicted GH43/DUF377 family glycosyl hydrolase